MKKFLLCTDGSAYGQVAYEYAVWLGMQMEIAIEILDVTDSSEEQAVKTKDFSGSISIDSYQQLLGKLVADEKY